MTPRLSVIIPARNAMSTLPQAIASAQAMPLDPFEIIVIDDGSTDETWAWLQAESARDPRIVPVRRTTNHGVSAARNAGIALARAPLIGFLDADDIWHAEPMAARVRWHEAHPDTVLSFADYKTLLPGGVLRDRTLAYWPRFHRFVAGRSGMLDLGAEAFGLLVGENPVCTSSVIARGGAVLAAGGFDTKLRQAEDWDLWIRLAQHGQVATSTASEIYHRDHPGSITRKVGERVASLREVVRRHSAQAWRRAPGAALAARCMLAQAENELAQHEHRPIAALWHSIVATIYGPSVKLARDAARAALVVARIKPPVALPV